MLVTCGKCGVGKSTLINNLLGLKGEKAAKVKFSAAPVTRSVDYYEEEVHGITVRIIDTPDLETWDFSSEEALAKITDGKADLMLYCVAMTNRIDKYVVQKATKAFGKEIWRHTILVLTFGDELRQEGGRDLLEEITEQYTKEFERVLKKAGVDDVPVKSILSAQDTNTGSESESIQQPKIIGIPVGRHAGRPNGWELLLFNEIFRVAGVLGPDGLECVVGFTIEIYGFTHTFWYLPLMKLCRLKFLCMPFYQNLLPLHV